MSYPIPPRPAHIKIVKQCPRCRATLINGRCDHEKITRTFGRTPAPHIAKRQSLALNADKLNAAAQWADQQRSRLTK